MTTPPPPPPDVITLTALPAMTVCSIICPYLDLEDLLSLRRTSKVLYRHLHKENDISEEVWKLVLERDFGLPPLYGPDGRNNIGDGNGDDNEFWIIPVQQASGVSNLAPEGMVVSVPSRFEAVKAWKKVSSVFFDEEGFCDLPPSSRTRRVYAPYFLRAACFWQNICRWCHEPDPDGPTNTQVRRNIYNSLDKGMGNADWPNLIRNRPNNSRGGAHTCQAVYAFCGGQGEVNINSRNYALLGARRAYGHISYMTFTAPRFQMAHGMGTFVYSSILVALGTSHGIIVDEVTGSVKSQDFCRPEFSLPAVHLPNHNAEDDADNGDGGGGRRQPPQLDHLLLWLEEHARRLQTGEIGIGRITNDYGVDEKRAIVLYPRYIIRQPIATTAVVASSLSSLSSVSRTVTRGIEVVASSVYVPHMGHQFGFIYSIRIQILHPNEDGYMSREDRGFHKCQLLERHWTIVNHETGQTSHVDGRGVIGMFPILWDGGFTDEDGNNRDGPFEYQSCTGQMDKGGTFGGYLTFVPDPPEPGSLEIDADHGTTLFGATRFRVEVGTFALNSQPTFFY